MKTLLWLSICCLDAPLVALLWYRVYAKVFELEHAQLGWQLPASLFLAVWSIYLIDRFFDGRRISTESNDLAPSDATPRHRAAREYGVFFAGGAAIAALGSFLLALQHLPSFVFVAAAQLSLLVAVHLYFAQRWKRYPKELLCGVIFALGLGLPLLADLPLLQLPRLLFLLMPFAGVCVLNCWAVSRYEGDAQPRFVGYRAALLLLFLYCGLGIFSESSAMGKGLNLILSAALLAMAVLDYRWQLSRSSQLRYYLDLILIAVALFALLASSFLYK